jgi:GTP cyclohydrolase II
MTLAAAGGPGVLLYVRGHGRRDEGLAAELADYAAEQQGRGPSSSGSGNGAAAAGDAHPADVRDTAIAAQMLRHLGLPAVRLLTDDPAAARHLSSCGIAVTACAPLSAPTHAASGAASGAPAAVAAGR